MPDCEPENAQLNPSNKVSSDLSSRFQLGSYEDFSLVNKGRYQ